MRYVQISPKLFLVEQEIVKAKTQPAKEQINHIWIYDRSGSMLGTLPQLAKDLKEKARSIPVGDTLTLGWFSSDGGEYRFMLKGFKITDKKDYELLDKTIDQNKSTMGSTCFSEILADTQNVIKDLSAFGTNFALCFFTDGYPTVYPYEKEVKAIYAAIEKIEGQISSSLLVGYGNYYNKELMSQMAERLGGALTHSGDIAAFSTALNDFIADSRENDGKIKVELEAHPDGNQVVFGINGKSITLYAPDKGTVNFVPSKRLTDSVFVLTDRVPSGSVEVKFTEALLRAPGKFETIVRGAYAASYILTQRTKTDLALEVLAALGDKALIDSVNNAFTNAEYGQAESKMQQAMVNQKRRFENGLIKNYLPSANAFCLLDALKILMADKEANFYPYHDTFDYQRIGAGSKVKEGYPEFLAESNPKCGLSQLTWNDTKLNLSVLAKIDGHIKLPRAEAHKNQLPEHYPTWVYRNYALVKDGFLNVKKLPVSLSRTSFDKLRSEGVIENPSWVQGAVYTLHLDRVPVINRSIAEGKTSAKDLCKKVLMETEIEGQLKALNFLRKEIDPDGATRLMKGAALTPDQELFLKEKGVGKNGFSPEVEKLPATDFYMAKEFEIKIKGLASLPSAKDVKEKMDKGGKLTPGALLVKAGFDLVNNDLKKSASDSAKIKIIDENISDLKYDLLRVRSDIQETKFAIILGKRWFDEFTSRENNTLKLGDKDFSIAVGEIKVEL